MVEEWKTINDDKKPKTLTLLVIAIIIIIVSALLYLAYSNGFGGGTKENHSNKTGYTSYYTSIKPFEAYSLIVNDANLTIIDVRECECAYDKGHISKAIWSIIPEDFYESTNDLLIYCSNGTTDSITFIDNLVNHTSGSIYHLDGGIEAWERAGFTIII